jgi:putative methyltransferase
VDALQEKENRKVVFQDDIVPGLLLFAPGTDLHKHVCVTQGQLIMQDKASCLPAVALQPQRDWTVLDSCASPGNKTTLLAALMFPKGLANETEEQAQQPESEQQQQEEGKGHIHAFELDEGRKHSLVKMIYRAGAGQCITAHHQDFTQVDVHDAAYADVRGILCDPSCSGSGMVHRLDQQYQREQERKVSSEAKQPSEYAVLQHAIVSHALRFPHVQRVVYSTCSVYSEENECVVRDLLEEFGGDFELYRVLPRWTRRGQAVEGLAQPLAELCVRADAQEDAMNGFFVAGFVRKTPASSSSTPSEQQQEGESKKQQKGKKSKKSKKKKRRRGSEAGQAVESAKVAKRGGSNS